jgi:small nuclear ribonucleoprotein G
MEKRLSLQLNGSRKVVGILRGYDPFMNVVLDDTIEEVSAGEKHNIGKPHLTYSTFTQVIRGNSIVSMEALERIS